jgi:uncharacterized protein YebE (UPF0316 family)
MTEFFQALSPSIALLAIFALRVVEVTMSTLRIILLIRGRKALASTVAFFASLTWLAAAAAVFSNLDSPARAFMFAAGYAAGTLAGGWLDERLALGKQVIRIFTPVDTPSPADDLRQAGFLVTVLNAQGLTGRVRLAFAALDRKRVPEALSIIRTANPEAFVTVEDVNIPNLRTSRLPRR